MELYSSEIVPSEILEAYFHLDPSKPPKSEFEIEIESFTCSLVPEDLSLEYTKPSGTKVEKKIGGSEFALPWLAKNFDENFILRRDHINSIFVSFETTTFFEPDESHELKLKLQKGNKIIYETSKIETKELVYIKLFDVYNIKLIADGYFAVPNFIKNGRLVHVLASNVFNNLQLTFKVKERLMLKNFQFSCVDENLEKINIINPVLNFNLV